VITRLGLVERKGPFFIQQVYGRQPKHRARDLDSEPTGFLVGRVSKGRKGARLVVGSKALRPARSVIKGDAYVGPRVDHTGVAATVSHHNAAHLSLHRHHRGKSARISQTGARGRREKVQTISAPVFGPHGLLFYRAIGGRTMEVYVVDGNQRRRILETGDRVGGKNVSMINLGWHTDQVDRHGRIAFQVETGDGSTAILMGTPA